MKAIRIHQHGGQEVLQIDDIVKPDLGPDDVLVKIKACGLNHLDIFVRKGIPGLQLPLIMGSDGAGEVIQCGENVSAFKQGDQVINMPFRFPLNDPLYETNSENLSKNYKIPGEHLNGLMAEYVSIPQDFVMQKPVNIDFTEAAAFPLASLTAYHMLIRKVNLSKSQWVLIYGASSGVGSAAIQIAKALGGNVITTAGSDEKADMAISLGADYVINYKQDPIGKTAKDISNGGVDVVLEHTGEKTWQESLRALKTGGKLVTCGATTGYSVNIDLRALFIKQQHIIGSTMGTRQDMFAVTELVKNGKLKPVVSKKFAFDEIKAAHQWLESGNQFGKVVIFF